MLSSNLEDKIDFSQVEKFIIQFWEQQNIFEAIQNERRKDFEAGLIKSYSFYDGPPFATGLPHYGHILAGTIKDVMTRYATQRNRYVERRFGWDCHGLPVEYEIDKKLGIHTAHDVATMGIATYNRECRQIVMRYAEQWEEVIKRTGRWIDFRNDYKTMYPWYMESVWWVFAQLFAKGMVYKGTKIMPFSVGCRTPISNFEAGQNFKEISDECLTLALDVVTAGEFFGNKLLIWTTTPWTLPANRAICANARIKYVRIQDMETGIVYIVAKNRINETFRESKTMEVNKVSQEFYGTELKNLQYNPPFEHYKLYEKDIEFRVILDDFVTDDEGTGLVHLAPYFGEDDYRVCLSHGLINNAAPNTSMLDENGKFTEHLPDLEGVFFKDANEVLIEKLKRLGQLFTIQNVKHSYPFCWRSDTPLIYKAVPSWFVRVEHIIDELKGNIDKTNWVPEIVKEKRFANWLSGAHDWAVSRNRYWGTPIPIWISETGDEIVCIASIRDLQQHCGVSNITDLHRESIDHLVIPSAHPGRPPLRRISEVFDCWFESGAMPYAQAHYPFKNGMQFQRSFPADFVAEGIDQTRGWFYTLLVISTALFNRPPFYNAIINGLVLASDGQKMSKRKQNYPDPMEMVNKYGADALRFYLLNSPLVRAGNLSFREDGVRNIVKSILIPWYNTVRFLLQSIKRFECEEQKAFLYDKRFLTIEDLGDIFDVWLISYNETLLQHIVIEMKAYRLYRITPRLMDFVGQLTNWYIRFKRAQLKGHQGTEVCQRTINICFYILLSLCKNMASFMPFFTEFVYQKLSSYMKKKLPINSIHNLKLCKPNQALINTKVERSMDKFQKVVILGRRLRERRSTPLKYAVKEIVVMHIKAEYLEDLKNMKIYLLNELNCQNLILTTAYEEYGIFLRAEPNYKLLGQRFKEELKEIQNFIKNLKHDTLSKAIADNKDIIISDQRLVIFKDILVRYTFKVLKDGQDNEKGFFEFANDDNFLVGINFSTTEEMYREGIARELISHVQKLKKAARLTETNQVIIFYTFPERSSKEFAEILSDYRGFISETIKSDFQKLQQRSELENKISENIVYIKKNALQLYVCRQHYVK